MRHMKNERDCDSAGTQDLVIPRFRNSKQEDMKRVEHMKNEKD